METWVEQLQNSINTLDRLKSFIHVTKDEEAAVLSLKTLWGTTPYFASLMEKEEPDCPIRKQVIPSIHELQTALETTTFISETKPRNVSILPECIVRKYPDRVAFLVSTRCASYCRYCFRKELVMNLNHSLRPDPEEGFLWIRKHKEIRDVLITGGDPFILSDERIEHLVRKLREIPHVEMIRFGTRIPVVLPQRITKKLKKILDGCHRVPIWINIQCNHPKEITRHTAKAVYDLLSCGINMGNQAVLLKGINDDVDTFRALHQKLLSVRVRPYYLFHCEPAPGNEHFRTRIETGAELIRNGLYGHTTGLAQPMYAVDTDAGKCRFEPDLSGLIRFPYCFPEEPFQESTVSESGLHR